MAKVGLRYPVFAPITQDNNGGMPTYGKGIVIGHAISADLSFTHSNNKLYADDRVVESDNTITGGTVTLGTDDLLDDVQVAMLGVREEGSGAQKEYIEGGEGPDGGFGYIRVRRKNRVTSFIAYWVYKVAFSLGDESAQTKGESIDWQTPTVTGDMKGISNGAPDLDYRTHATFATEAAAIAWLNDKAGITAA